MIRSGRVGAQMGNMALGCSAQRATEIVVRVDEALGPCLPGAGLSAERAGALALCVRRL